jgi:predicted Zn-dependent peptidase
VNHFSREQRRQLIVFLLLLLCISVPLRLQERFRRSPPFPEPLKELILPQIETSVLSNGLDITVAHTDTLPLISMKLIILDGESSSPKNLPGLASFTANMLGRGSVDLSSSELEETIESIGGTFSSSTFLDYSVFTFTFLEDYLDNALELLSKMILQPSFIKREIDNEKRDMFYTLRAQGQKPDFVAKNHLLRLIFEDHPYYKTTFTEDFITNITQSDVRSFFEKYYRPNNAYIVFTGNLNLNIASRKVSHYLNTWERKDIERIMIPAVNSPEKVRICLVDLPNSTDSTIYIGSPIFPRNSEDFFPFIVLNQVLGGTTTSRLFMNLRESKGYAFFAFSEVSFFKKAGFFFIRARVRSEVTYASVRECLREIDRIIREEITTFEIEQAKSYLLGNLPLGLRSLDFFCSKVSEVKTFNLGLEYWNKYYENIMLVNSKKVYEVAQKYVLDNPIVVIVSDKNRIIDHLRNFEAVEVYDKKGALQYVIGEEK